MYSSTFFSAIYTIYKNKALAVTTNKVSPLNKPRTLVALGDSLLVPGGRFLCLDQWFSKTKPRWLPDWGLPPFGPSVCCRSSNLPQSLPSSHSALQRPTELPGPHESIQNPQCPRQPPTQPSVPPPHSVTQCPFNLLQSPGPPKCPHSPAVFPTPQDPIVYSVMERLHFPQLLPAYFKNPIIYRATKSAAEFPNPLSISNTYCVSVLLLCMYKHFFFYYYCGIVGFGRIY